MDNPHGFHLLEDDCAHAGAADWRRRFPHKVCRPCLKRTVDKDGRKLWILSVDNGNGVRGIYRDSKEPYLEQTCFISGVPCSVQPALFDGFIVEPI